MKKINIILVAFLFISCISSVNTLKSKQTKGKLTLSYTIMKGHDKFVINCETKKALLVEGISEKGVLKLNISNKNRLKEIVIRDVYIKDTIDILERGKVEIEIRTNKSENGFIKCMCI